VWIGAELQSGYLNIKRLFAGSPAESGGQLHPGDRVIAVAQGNRPFMETRNLGLPELVQTIRGQPGTTVRLQVLPADAGPDSPPRTVSIVRSQYKVKQ
jgi:carboxyl-terminal processing protease